MLAINQLAGLRKFLPLPADQSITLIDGGAEAYYTAVFKSVQEIAGTVLIEVEIECTGTTALAASSSNDDIVINLSGLSLAVYNTGKAAMYVYSSDVFVRNFSGFDSTITLQEGVSSGYYSLDDVVVKVRGFNYADVGNVFTVKVAAQGFIRE